MISFLSTFDSRIQEFSFAFKAKVVETKEIKSRNLTPKELSCG
jgi:hypothetical protein